MARDIFLGASGITVSSMLVLIMLLLMLTMSFRLMLSRRKKAYLSLTFSLLLLVGEYLFIAITGLDPNGDNHNLIASLRAFSFIALNVGLYQLYNTTKRKVTLLAALGVFVAVLIIGARYYAESALFAGTPVGETAAQVSAFLNIWMDIYLYVLTFLCFIFVTPTIGQTGKYQMALAVYFLMHTAAVLNNYVYNRGSEALTFAQHFLPVVFFFIIFLFIFERVIELMQAVYHSSITDGLTGLYNRRFFSRRLQQYVAAGIPVSVIFTDIDNFKKLNDTEGHQRGDEALKQVASIVMEEAEDIGIPGRYGGEEIVMIVTEPKENAAKIAERIRSRIEAEAGVTVSVGYAKLRKNVTAEQLLKQADMAMYASKMSGKNRVTAYKSGMTDVKTAPTKQ